MKAKDKLRATWSKREGEVVVHFPLGCGTKSDARYLMAVFAPEVVEELRCRGYDVTTLKFEISPQADNDKFSSQRNKEE